MFSMAKSHPIEVSRVIVLHSLKRILWRGRFIGGCCLRVVGSVGIHLQSCKGCVGGLWFSCGIASVKGILGLRGEGGTGR